MISEDSIFSVAENLHILGGLIAACIALIPVFSWRNRLLHRRSGRVFLVTMIIASITALALALRTTQQGDVDFYRKAYAVFHIQLAVAVLCSLQQGTLVFKHKARKKPLLTSKTLAFPIILSLASSLTLFLGIRTGQSIYYAYSILAFCLVGFQIRFWTFAPGSRKSWLGFHLVNLLYCCSLTFTALILETITRINRVPIEETPVWIWLIPFYFSIPWMLIQIKNQGLSKNAT